MKAIAVLNVGQSIVLHVGYLARPSGYALHQKTHAVNTKLA